MAVATRRELLEAGVHFGHQTRRWNPKMRRFIFGERSGIYIIDLEKTLTLLGKAHDFLVDIGRRNGSVLFVGTKKQAQETIEEQASRVAMPHVTTRWLGGMLTNFQTIHTRLRRLRELREMERSGAFDYLPKKEVLKLRHEKGKLERNLAGIQDMDRLPDAVYVIDTKREQIAVKEARKLGIPVVAIVDTNCDPDEVDYVIPGNDDAIRACSLITKVLADAIQEGQYLAYRGMQDRGAEPEFEEEASAPFTFDAAVPEERRPVQLSDEEAAFFGPEVDEQAGEQQAADQQPGEPSEPEQPAAETSATWAAPAEGATAEETVAANARVEGDGGEAIEADLDRQREEPGAPPDSEPSSDESTTAEDGADGRPPAARQTVEERA
jgi:small subunit ribosomal protein S2